MLLVTSVTWFMVSMFPSIAGCTVDIVHPVYIISKCPDGILLIS